MKKFYINTTILFTFFFIFSIGLHAQEICNNGIDDDGDGLIDMNDVSDCNCAPIVIPSMIPNASFEQSNCCPSSFSQVSCATGWSQATNATSDYFNCGFNFGSATNAGLSPPPDGTGYLGTIFSPGWQEYVGSCLTTPMLAGQSYTLTINIASAPIGGSGEICNGGVIEYGPIDITIFGNPSCVAFPISTTACPPGWTVLASAIYTPVASWGSITFTFTPSANINAIIIGSPCTLPASYTTASGCYPYFYYDNLILTASSATNITQVGSFCSNDLVLSTVNNPTSTYQWYLAGIALIGETSNTLSISTNNYPPGNYTLVENFSNGTCGSMGINLIAPPTVTANFSSINQCYGNAINFTDASSTSSGTITNWQWNFGDGNTSILQNPSHNYLSDGIYTVQLIVSDNSQCSDTVSFNVTVYPKPISIINYSFSNAGQNAIGGCLNETIQFADSSTISAIGNITSWQWNFGDGNTSTTQNPSHQYASSGNYTVQLIVTSTNNCSDTSSINIAIYDLPTASFNFTNVCFGTTTSFTDQSIGNGGTINQWAWDFTNNGLVESTLQNPTNGYVSPGSYSVELFVETANGCKDSVLKIITVNPIPVASFTATDECLGNSNIFSDASTVTSGSISSWAWDFGNGSGTSTLQNPTYYYSNDGVFNVILTVTSDSGCTNNIIKPITVYPSPTANFIVNNSCLNVSAQCSDLSVGNGGLINQWEWDFTNNGSIDNSTQNPLNLYSTDGIFDIKLIVSTSDGCKDTVIVPVTIYPMPTADFTFTNECLGVANNFIDNSLVSSGTITNWNWNFGNLNNSTLQNPSELYGSDGNFDVILVVTTNDLCQDTITKTINVWPLPIVDYTPTDVCLNNPTQFNDLSTVPIGTNIGWLWNFDDSSIQDNSQSPIHIYSTDGTYQVELHVTTNHNCVDSLTKTVTVYPLPQVGFFADSLIGCTPVIVNFTDNSTINAPGINTTYLWNFGNSGFSTQQNPLGINFVNLSNSTVSTFGISLTVISDKGCIDKDSISNMITSYPIPMASFTYNPLTTDIYDKVITFTDQSIIASQWLWDLGDGASTTLQNPMHEYPDSGLYTVTLFIENTYGCKDTTSKNVRINPVYAIYIPNAFTPDGDKLNDYFSVKSYGIIQLDMQIFDRWGEKIWEGHLLDDKWDGLYKGKMVATDIYVYKIRARDVFKEWHDYIGKVSLLR